MAWRRKVFHLGFGLLAIGLVLLERELAILFLLISFLAGLAIMDWKLKGHKVPVADELLVTLSRKGEPPGYGAFWFVLGLLAIVCYVQGTSGLLASLLMLGVSDAASGLAGLHGKTRIPYNKNKTLQGSRVFFGVSLISFVWIGWLAVPFALLGALVESVDVGFDDNLLISLLCILFFGAAGGLGLLPH